MKILFLDIDGVLNSAEYMRERRHLRRPTEHSIDALAVPRLNAITDRTGACIVVSSTWRIGRTTSQLAEILRMHGVTGRVIDRTPTTLKPYAPGDDAMVVAQRVRGYEIQSWLDLNPDVKVFAIVDDDQDMLHLRDRLVRTTWERGLQDEHVERLVAMLGESEARRL